MRGLTIIVASVAADRYRSALTLACAQAALGGRARLFLDGGAVAVARTPLVNAQDAAHTAAGLPTLAALQTDSLDLGVEILACQTALAMAGESADLDPRIQPVGMIDLLQTLAEDRLLFA